MKLLRLLLLALLCRFSWALPPVEVVLTVPVETDLGVVEARNSQTVWLEMIQGARQTLDIEQFYVSDKAGEPLAPVLEAIKDAGKRNVKVRLLVDSKFYKTYPDSVKQIGETKNSEARTIDFSRYGGVQHAKFFIVDGKDSFSGSQNFDWRALSHIHEVGLRIQDLAVAESLGTIFEKDWAEGLLIAKGELPSPVIPPATSSVADADISVVAAPEKANPPGMLYSGDAIVELIASARKTLNIQVMEYTTKGDWHLLENAIREAATKNRVKVQLLVDDSKKSTKDFQNLKKEKNIHIKTVKIPEWSGGPIEYARLIHSKYLVVDGVDAWVGSENWSEGYFLQTRDVGFRVHSQQVAGTLNLIFDKVWQGHYAKNF